MQVMLLNAAKDVAAALSDLINSTKNASGKSATHPAMDALKSSAKVTISLALTPNFVLKYLGVSYLGIS